MSLEAYTRQITRKAEGKDMDKESSSDHIDSDNFESESSNASAKKILKRGKKGKKGPVKK